jgi:hypothetical protein
MSTNSRRGSSLQDVEAAQTSDEPDREVPPILHGFERNLEAEEVQLDPNFIGDVVHLF